MHRTTWTTDLGREMRALLARLEMVSAGTTASWGGGGGDGQPLPQSGDANPPHLTYRDRFEKAHDRDLEHEARTGGRATSRRRDVIRAAADELERLTGRNSAARPRPAGETSEELDARIVAEGQGYTVKEAAVKFRTGERNVIRARQAAGREIERGDPIAPVTPDAQREALERAEDMALAGKSVRYIAMCTGLSKSAVHRHLRQQEVNRAA